MDSKTILKNYYSRLAKESFIKSLMWGLLIGFSMLLISAAVCWFVAFKGIWLCIVLFAVATAGATPILYYKVFKPTVKKTAKRTDALGLEERLLTMTELEGDNSYIAKRQKEDALAALKKVSSKLIKFAIPVHLIVTLAIVAVFGTGMTTAAALREVEEEVKPQYSISYRIQGSGSIQGEVSQEVEEGESTIPVMAMPDEHWVFVGWSDGYADPYRLDTEISDDIEVYALFEEMDQPENLDEDPNDNDGEGEGELGEGEGNPFQLPDEKPGDENEDEKEGGGAYEDKNQIIDGETYYGDSNFDNAYDDAMDDLSGDNDMSDDLKGIIQDYYDTIAK